MAHVRDGGAFHLAAFGVEGFCDALLFGIAAYETVARCDAAPMRRHANFGCSVDDGAAEFFIHGEGERVGARRLAHGVTQVAYVHDVVHGIGRHNHIADFNGCVERAGDAGVEHCSHAETVYEDLRAGGCVNHAHAALHNDDARLANGAFDEFHAGKRGRMHFAAFLHLLFEECDFDIHCANNADGRLRCHSIPSISSYQRSSLGSFLVLVASYRINVAAGAQRCVRVKKRDPEPLKCHM